MTYLYGSYVGAQTSGKVTHRAWLNYSLTKGTTEYSGTLSMGVDPWNSKWGSINTHYSLARTGYTTASGYKDLTLSSGDLKTLMSGYTFRYTRGHSATTKTITAKVWVTGVDAEAGGASVNSKVSTAKLTLSIPAKPSYAVKYNANGGSGAPSAQTKWYGETLKLSTVKPTRSGYNFVRWNTKSDGTGTKYNSGANYTSNSAVTLYAIWSITNPPTCDATMTSDTNVIKNFTDVTVDISNIHVQTGRTFDSIRMVIGDHESNVLTGNGTLTIEGTEFTTDDIGTNTVYIVTEDSLGAIGTYAIGTITITAPTWSRDVSFSTAPPQIDTNGNAILEGLYVKNYTTNVFDPVPISGHALTLGDSDWSIELEFDENHVDDPLSDSPETDVKVAFTHVETEVKESGQSFYSTSRNQNYSNGIYNVMFVGGVGTEWANYSSRVWWSKINNPLYFPDTNYVEVGSNDTAVQGLTKVGDYLAVIKQSKTTDTAIFLLYPTSFDEETTYAVKQGVQGVGALSRYSFNILGDETLFLSPKGVMAVVPTQDEEHKVQNRSYFVDKRLLAEDGIETAYSFVYDGKYYLSIGNGHVYVLDGNQRNSWGNDRTVLVYECYFLDNVPAKCFVKYHDALVFSTEREVCMFNDSYSDAYGEDGNDVPVKAEWSTVFDDDGSLHYYKTMQKKGNLVSILPIDNETGYKQIEIDEETFNEDKSLYYILVDGEYIQCTDESVYDENEDYYIIHHSATKVLVRKDDKEPVEIERTFGRASSIPSELFLNKKFKKYKRLQFIIRNEEDEDFGVDEIIKNYTVGNYAKK